MPEELEKVEDCCHRIGMKGELISNWFELRLADELVDTLLANKDNNIKLLYALKTITIKRKPVLYMIYVFFGQVAEFRCLD